MNKHTEELKETLDNFMEAKGKLRPMNDLDDFLQMSSIVSEAMRMARAIEGYLNSLEESHD